tara:strand:- start:37093 stop:38856 length:1764 start_codon:yes stop_codon:yes gene_type:complete
MRKYIIYFGILIAGLLLGWMLFGNTNPTEAAHDHSQNDGVNEMWTCSMHPQIMQPEAGSCPICGMDLIPADAGASGLAADQFQLTQNALALANVQTTVISANTSTGNAAINLSGKIAVNDDETAIQPAHFNGRIEKLYVNSLGESVRQGQAVAQIYSPELIAAQQELITAYKLKESQPQLYQAVYAKFKNWKIHGPQLDKVLETGNVKSSFTIYSHVSGVVTEILVNEGAHITDGKSIFKVSNLSTVWANFDVYENQISLFKKGQKINIVSNAYPDKTFAAKVSYIDPILNSQTRTVVLRAVLNNAKGLFKPGMFVEGAIETAKNTDEKELVTIPATAVLWTGKRSVVYIKPKSDASIFEMREISLGNKIGANYEVLSGLSNQEEIVTNGAFTVDAAAQLQGKKSMMNKDGGKTTTGHEGHLGMNASEGSTTKPERIVVSSVFQTQLNTVFDAYIQLKDALIDEKKDAATQNGTLILKALDQVDMTLLTDAGAHNEWMKLLGEIGMYTKSIVNASTIKEQRNHFSGLSLSIKNAVQIFGINKKVYSHFCPMVADNTGAFWLSNEDNVLNPYFGQEMLTCGEVKEVIK